MSLTPRFITVEGTEGVGKSTCLQFIAHVLENHGCAVCVTREPGGTPIAEQIRALLLHQQEEPMDLDAELLLMFAARAQHIAQVIRPALARGEWVVCDRFTDSTYAYQGGGRGIDPERIQVLEHFVQGDFQPDLTLVLDAPVSVGKRRAKARSKPDRIESEEDDFFERIRQTFLARAADMPSRYRVIDAAESLPAVEQAIIHALQTVLR